MTATIKQNLKALDRSIWENTPVAKQQLSQSGAKPEAAIVFSVAKCYTTIEKLAKE